ncbi:MAG: chromate transporter [Peptoniphilus harei]|uniref:Chromate transport protein n=1 Tax=Peptoniphilus harei ACS-146-V-Sch2b TaxID=908338 RepID=E4KZH6_9FIRM|nr:chromate transporter [Peptoniphilus harei]EFR32719.1 chromate transport protein [Peptoniphilus harei ACS-146-V-Sch2b]MDK7754785.1 chromate transporter [Peptoniphilus harei]MDK7760591.1 chromate transporter [Peptoniphilus harei]MDK8270382.1 chromate transporter [Peptoniphilus harei]MDK8338841.1 chromate transporter [Peptoniphilus harei]
MLDLFLIFFKIGCFAFGGGYAVIPLISKYVVEEHAWISTREFIDLISISQMTPGPIAINSATFVGQSVHGILGSILATTGLVLPQFILMMILGYFLFSKGKKFKIMDYSLLGIKAGVVSLIFITTLKLFQSSVFSEGFKLQGMSLAALISFVLGFLLYLKKIDLFKLIVLGAVIGIAVNLALNYI